jgi:signal transduction histidine kinase/CheY-like chemotaxis protein
MFFARVKSSLKKVFSSPSGMDGDGIQFWRERILFALLVTSALLGIVALGPALVVAAKERLWALMVVDTSMYLCVLVLLFGKNLKYELRAAGILVVGYTVGIWVILQMGALSGGPAWLFGMAVFTGVLLGLKAALLAIVANGVSLGIIGWMMFNGSLVPDQPFFNSLGRALAAGANFLFLNAAAAVAVAVLVRGLQATAEKEKAASKLVRQERAELIDARESLKNEINVRKGAEEALRIERDTLDRITRSVGAGLAVISTDYRTLWANAVLKKLFGADIEGKLCYETYNQRPAVCPSCGVRQVLEEGKDEVIHEQEGLDAAGNRIWSQIIATPIRDSEGKVSAALELVVPITERKLAEEERRRLANQLEQARKMEAIATLAGGVAHQFNNLLSAISGNIELLKLDAAENPHMERYCTPMEQSVQRMAQLTGQLLAYARGGKYRIDRLCLSEFVRQTLPLVKHSLKPTITVEADLPEDVARVEVDITQMQTVLAALLANASEAIEAQGRVRIACRNRNVGEEEARTHPGLLPGSYAVMSVEDTGRGMDEETKSRVFEPFFTTKFQGRGLGMASVYGIVKNHAGWISVDSTPGEGTIVSILLPTVPAPAVSAGKSAQPLATEPELVSGAVLLVEDEGMVLEVTRSMLERIGYRVLCAQTGREALDIARSKAAASISLVILDIILPDMGGKDLYPLLTEALPGVKVIVCSGYTLDGPARQILELGADGFIQKPFRLSDLSQKIAEVCSTS